MPRVRFAPSPTGTLHVGNAMSAVANRRFGDWMLLRIDDTDLARNLPGGEEAILDDLRWLGIDWDDGPVRQSDRAERHLEAARAAGLPQRFDGVMLWRDEGTPTFHLASVVDDIDYEITHVIRGSDHRANEELHGALHRALGSQPPEVIHHGLLVGADGKKLSKRAEGTTIASLRDAGYPAEAVRAYFEELGLPRHDVHLDLDRIRSLSVDVLGARGQPRHRRSDLPTPGRRGDPGDRGHPDVDTWTFTAAGLPWIDQQWGAQASSPRSSSSAAGRAWRCSGRCSSGSSSVACSSSPRRARRPGQRADARRVRGRGRGPRPPPAAPRDGALRGRAAPSPTGGPSGPLWLIPLIVLAWANIHGSFFLGPLVLGLAWLEDLHERVAQPHRLAGGGRVRGGRVRHAIRPGGLDLRRGLSRPAGVTQRIGDGGEVVGADPGHRLRAFGVRGRRAC